MRIDRRRAAGAFQNYVRSYDIGNEKIRLKIEHTYRVSDLCDTIARSLGLPEEDADLAWLTGLLHDVGRFEQLRRFGTFIDEQSIDHAAFGVKLLFEDGRIRDYIEDAQEDALIEAAVACHSAYRIPEGLDARMERFCHVLRDADKIDILRVSVEFPLEEIYNTTREELRNSQVTEAVMESFEGEHAVLKALRRSAADHVVGHISLVYELVYPASLKIMQEQGCLKQLMDFRSDNAVAAEQFAEIRDKMTVYVQKRTSA